MLAAVLGAGPSAGLSAGLLAVGLAGCDSEPEAPGDDEPESPWSPESETERSAEQGGYLVAHAVAAAPGGAYVGGREVVDEQGFAWLSVLSANGTPRWTAVASEGGRAAVMALAALPTGGVVAGGDEGEDGWWVASYDGGGGERWRVARPAGSIRTVAPSGEGVFIGGERDGRPLLALVTSAGEVTELLPTDDGIGVLEAIVVDGADLYVAGAHRASGASTVRPWICRLTARGVERWCDHLDQRGLFTATGLALAPTGELLVSTATVTEPAPGALAAYSAAGDRLWTRSLVEGDDGLPVAKAVATHPDSEDVWVAGWMGRGFGASQKFWLARVEPSAGVQRWSQVWDVGQRTQQLSAASISSVGDVWVAGWIGNGGHASYIAHVYALTGPGR